MVADSVIYHPTVAHYLKFVATTVGRDKVMRTLQYFARFYSWYLLRMNGSPSEIAPWDALKKTFGLVRRALRLGKSVEHLKAAAQAYDASTSTSSSKSVAGVGSAGGAMDPFLRYCAIGRQLGYAGYMAFDNVLFVHQSGVRPFAKERADQVQRTAYRSWFVGLAFNIVAGCYQLRELKQREKEINTKEGEGAMQQKRLDKERESVNLQLVSDLCDIAVPSLGLGLGGRLLDEGIIGLAGVTSSLIGVHSVWQKTA